MSTLAINICVCIGFVGFGFIVYMCIKDEEKAVHKTASDVLVRSNVGCIFVVVFLIAVLVAILYWRPFA